MHFKKKLYIGTALLALVGLYMQIQFERGELHDALNHAGYFMLQLEIFLSAAIRLFSIGALVALCLFQLKKETPKVMMLTCGAVLFTSMQDFLDGMVVLGAFLAAAAILPIILFISDKPKEMPMNEPYPPHNRLLVAAGILSSVLLVCYVYSYFLRIDEFYLNQTFYIIPILYMALDVGKIITCFLYTKKRALLLRMLFFGDAVWNAIIIPVSVCITIFLSTNTLVEKVFNVIMPLLDLAAIILVIVHTLKIRKAEKAQTAQVQDENLLTEKSL